MQVHRYSDAGAFLNAAGAWLSASEVENNVLLTTASALADGTRVLEDPPYFAVVVDGNEIDCCAGRTPPHRLLVTKGTEPGMAALAADAFGALGRLPGVNGPRDATAAFAAAWLALAGGQATISVRMRLHAIERVSPDLPVSPGGLRQVTSVERDQAVQ